MSQIKDKAITPWEIQKHRLIKDYFLPVHEGKDFSTWNTFHALDYIFNAQSPGGHSIPGAAHLTFNHDVIQSVQMSPNHFSTFNDIRDYNWKVSAKEPRIYYDANINQPHRNYGTASSLLGKDNIVNIQPTTLSPDSSMEQLEEFMVSCQGPYAIGTDGSTFASKKLMAVSPFNMYTMNDFLSSLDKNDYPSLKGLVTPWPITGPAKSMTPMHVEDQMFASINEMVVPGIKLWFVLNSDVDNVKKFAKKAAKAIMNVKGGPFCEAWHIWKMWCFSPRVLHEWGVEFRLIWQTGVDIVITESYGFHQTVNITANITLARNFVYNRTPQVFDESVFLKCSCRLHKSLRLKFIDREYHHWVEADMQRPKPLTLRLNLFAVKFVNWFSGFRIKERVLDKSNKDFQKFFSKLPGNKTRIASIGAKKMKGEGQARELMVIVEHIENVTNAAIIKALQKTFHPFNASRSMEVGVVAHKDLKEKLGYNPQIVRDGYVDIPCEAGLVLQDFQNVEGIWNLNLLKGCSANRSIEYNKNGHARPKCSLCDCQNQPNHEYGTRHKYFLGVLKNVRMIFAERTQKTSATLNCPICPIGNIKSMSQHLEHEKCDYHCHAVTIQNKYFNNPKYFDEHI